MKNFTYQFFMPAVIAALTTIIATSLTSYLLARPWCIQIDSDENQRIVYGQTNCVNQLADWRQRPTVHGASVKVDTIKSYQ
ncbi:MAG: hypothetical protein F6K16_29400 [Symploca sp. SIO2B6]|nr:hypothetical protein [Symploca sp. SIO2B6]